MKIIAKFRTSTVCAYNHFPPSAGPTQSCASPPLMTQTVMAASLPPRQRRASRIASERCAPSSCPTPGCTLRSSSTNLWSCLSSSSDSRRPGSVWVSPSSWTTWTPSASPSPRPSRATRHPAAGGARGRARGRVKAERAGKEELQPCFKTLTARKVQEGTGRWQVLHLSEKNFRLKREYNVLKRLCGCSWRHSAD